MQFHPARFASFSQPQRSKSSKAPPDLRWPHPQSYRATPTTLATAGFYFNPSAATPDAVSCFICDKGLADWDPDDDPAQIHAEKCPKCPWAILRCITDADGHGSFNFASPSRLPASRSMEKARLATFGPDPKKWWPHDAKSKGPPSKTMAKAGFVYTPAGPKDDTCICIYCGIQLSGWQPDDDPTEEHRSRQVKNGPCPFFTLPSDTSAPAPAKQRARAKSKPPTTPAASASSEEEYQPPGAKSTRAAASSTSSKKPGSSAKSTKTKTSKKPTKTKMIEEEVVEEYQVALDDDEDAPPKPRPKPRNASSRASSRSRASSAHNNTTDESEPVASSTKKSSSSKSKSKSKRGHDSSPAEHKSLPSSSLSKKSTSKPSSSKAHSESEETQRSTRGRSRPPPSENERPRVVSKSKATTKAKGKRKAEVDDAEVDEAPAEKPARVRKGKDKYKAVETGEESEPEPEPEPTRGRTKVEAKAVEDSEEGDLEPSRGKPSGRTKAPPKAQQAKEGPDPLRGRTKGKSKAALRDTEDPERQPVPDPIPQPQPVARESKPSNGKIKSSADAMVEREDDRPAPGPARVKTKTKPSSKAKQEVPPPVQALGEVDEDMLQPMAEKAVLSKPAPPAPPSQTSQTNGIHYAPQPPVPIQRPQFKSFQSPEDEEFAREEQALEEQARELMLADATLTLTTTPLSKDRGRAPELPDKDMPGASFEKLNGIRPIDKGKGKAKMSPAEIAMDVDGAAPSTPPPSRASATTARTKPPSTVKFPQLVPDDAFTTLTDVERAMTVEEWVRHEMDRQYERLNSDGRQKIDAFKARADEIAMQIESL